MNPSDTRPTRGFGFGLLVGTLGCIGGVLLAVALTVSHVFGLNVGYSDQTILLLPPGCGIGVACFYWSSRQAFWGAIAGTLLAILCIVGLLFMWLSNLKLGSFAW